MAKYSLKFISFVAFLVALTSCSNKDAFTVEKNRVGVISSETKMMEIEGLFAKDSVVKRLSEGVLGYQGKYTQEDDFYLIYSKKSLFITEKGFFIKAYYFLRISSINIDRYLSFTNPQLTRSKTLYFIFIGKSST